MCAACLWGGRNQKTLQPGGEMVTFLRNGGGNICIRCDFEHGKKNKRKAGDHLGGGGVL